ncbi:MAG TPA: DNA mismatch repair protein MutS [Thermoanaerobaculia bacterium]|nr:DNA mismatch repair protein MutS [Thermoanaerobaculia bacterium]
MRELYAQHLDARRADAAALRNRERRTSIVRLLLIAAAVALAFWNLAAALVPVVLFVALVVLHERIIRARKRADNGAAFYERGLGRIDGTWQGKGDPGNDFTDDHHPYAGDFDVFGKGSLFELISIAVTAAGRRRLATWLKEPSRDANEIGSRQTAVLELRENVALREDMSIASSEVTREIESAKLDEWSALPPVTLSPAERIAALLFPAITIMLVLLSLPSLIGRLIGLTHPEAVGRFGAIADFPSWPTLISIVATLLLARRLHPRVEPIVIAVERAEPALALLGGVLARVERESFTSPRLVALHDRLRGAEGAASQEIERLRRLVALLDARRNQFFAPFAVLLLWTTHVAIAIERWRVRSGSRIGDWIEAVGEIEALASLASFAFEHPSFAMPQVVEGSPLFDAQALGHPLIPNDRRVTNDIRLDETQRLLVVSGSNMSGKSTMMRSAGIAAVLSMAGAPVCARSLRIAPTAVGASIRIADSLQENASRFYAEILRIRQVLEMSKEGPLLYLLDEVLAGTNSHDRRIGAEAIVRGLVERGAIGLVSTHDLALAQIAESLAPRAANVHFEDHIEDGRVVFDYRMRPGVVTKSNALALMRSVGIEV